MDADLLQKLKQDIPNTGYVTEMLVTSTLNALEWTALDHTFYLDRDENKGREIDVVAIKSAEEANNRKKVNVTLALAIEIKKVTNKPWVIFTSPRAAHEAIDGLFDTSLVRMNIQEIWFRDLYSTHAVAGCDRFGRVAYQAFSKKPKTGAEPNTKNPAGSEATKDEGYNLHTFGAFVSCFKASTELSNYIRQGERTDLRDASKIKTYAVGIVHGLLVVDGKLFEARVHARDNIDVSSADWVPYIFNYASKEYGNRRFLVDVVTVDHLRIYLERYSTWLQDRARFCLRELS